MNSRKNKLNGKKRSWFFKPMPNAHLGAVWILFLSPLITPHSIFITHHSLLKIPQFPNPHPSGTHNSASHHLIFSTFCGTHNWAPCQAFLLAYPPHTISSSPFPFSPQYSPKTRDFNLISYSSHHIQYYLFLLSQKRKHYLFLIYFTPSFSLLFIVSLFTIALPIFLCVSLHHITTTIAHHHYNHRKSHTYNHKIAYPYSYWKSHSLAAATSYHHHLHLSGWY